MNAHGTARSRAKAESSATKLVRSRTCSRVRPRVLGCAVLAVAALVSLPVRAADRPLTDADVERWLPRLRAEAAALTKQMSEARETLAELVSAVERRKVLLADMASGKTNIATWLRAKTDEALIPPGAIFSEQCSRELTEQAGAPTAVYTFGKESPHRDLLRRAASGDAAARDEFYRRRGAEGFESRSATGSEIHDFVVGMKSLYREHGFVDSGGPTVSIIVTILLSPTRSISATISEANYYCGLLPRDVPRACSSLPTGPLVEIVFSGDLLLPPARSESGTTAADDEVLDPEYERVRSALLLARADAADSAAIEFVVPPDAPAEVKARLNELAAEFATRRANVRLYRKHEAVLAPLLDVVPTTPE